MARLEPRAADMAMLALLAKGRCVWPECNRKIFVPVDGRFVADCDRAHIEAAEARGARWRSSMSDEERRNPDNLMWLCRAHHTTIDGNEEKYTVALLKQWKVDRQKQDPAQKFGDELSPEKLDKAIEDAVDRLVAELERIDLPGMQVAEMLVTASEGMPDYEVAAMLLRASQGMPNAEVASWLLEAGYRLPDVDTASSLAWTATHMPDETISSQLGYAADTLPSEGLISMLYEAANTLADTNLFSSLDSRVTALKAAVVEVDSAAETLKEAGVRAALARGPEPKNPWAWFGYGAGAAAVVFIIGLIAGIYLAHR